MKPIFHFHSLRSYDKFLCASRTPLLPDGEPNDRPSSIPLWNGGLRSSGQLCALSVYLLTTKYQGNSSQIRLWRPVRPIRQIFFSHCFSVAWVVEKMYKSIE